MSNGDIESVVVEVLGLIRRVKSDLKPKLGTRVERSHPLLPWLPTYVRCELGRDVRTAEKKRTGNNMRRPAFQFGEQVMVQFSVTESTRQAQGAFQPKMMEERNHAINSEGILRGAGARRLREVERWPL